MQERLGKLHVWWSMTVRAAQTVSGSGSTFLGQPTYAWVLSIILGVGAGLIGPFGTYSYAPVSARLTYWLIVMPVSFALWWGIDTAGARLIPGWPKERGELITMVPFSVANSFFLVALHAFFNSTMGSYFPTSWSDFFVGHVLITAFVVLPTIWIAKRLLNNASSRAGSDAIQFLTEKLPVALRGTVPFALEAEGHYVRVHTPEGTALVTMTFDDAMRCVVGIPGIQTHRSWWIARSAVGSIRKDGAAYAVELTSGLSVPVSRRRRPMVSKVIAPPGAG